MNRADRRRLGVTVETAPSITLTHEQLLTAFPDYKHGDMVTIACRRYEKEDRSVRACAPGEETPFCLEVIETIQ